MNYTTFKYRYSDVPIILSKAIVDEGNDGTSAGSVQIVRNQISRWQKRRLVVRLKNGMYLLNDHDRRVKTSRMYLANQMCVPSYVSLEFALAYYGLIPERVPEVTSVTTKKTLEISNPTGRYSYRHLSVSAFKGFGIVQDENGMKVFIAEPEKAVLDFLYLNITRTMKREILSPDIFSESYRFQDLGRLSEKRLLALATAYNSSKLTAVTKLFCRFRKEQARR